MSISGTNIHIIFCCKELSTKSIPDKLHWNELLCLLASLIYILYLLKPRGYRGTGSHLRWRRRGMSFWQHDDVIKWKHFPRNWPFVREIHRSPVNFPHKGQWRGALMFSLIYVWINGWVNNREAGDLRRQHDHYDVIVMTTALQVMVRL